MGWERARGQNVERIECRAERETEIENTGRGESNPQFDGKFRLEESEASARRREAQWKNKKK
jgi:hypothetical protein